jgi:hypothetical protein
MCYWGLVQIQNKQSYYSLLFFLLLQMLNLYIIQG